MVATIIPVCPSSILKVNSSNVPSFDLNHNPRNVPSSIPHSVPTNAIIHPSLICFQLQFQNPILKLIKSMNIQIKIQRISFQELLISTMLYTFTNGLLLITLLVSLSGHHQDLSFLKCLTHHPNLRQQTVYNSSVSTDTDPIMNHHHHDCYILFEILLEYCYHPLP